MNSKLVLKIRPLVVLIAVILFSCLSIAQSLAQSSDTTCMDRRSHWEKVVKDLQENLQSYSAIAQTPVERIVQHPLVDPRAGKTIAAQVGEALQVKEDLLNAKRKECRSILDMESQAFAELEKCSESEKRKNKELAKLSKQRRSLIDKAILMLSEVREVQGEETYSPYSQSAKYSDPYRGGNGYYQNYQQNYGRWWGR